jgi:hypothetical protein
MSTFDEFQHSIQASPAGLSLAELLARHPRLAGKVTRGVTILSTREKE